MVVSVKICSEKEKKMLYLLELNAHGNSFLAHTNNTSQTRNTFVAAALLMYKSHVFQNLSSQSDGPIIWVAPGSLLTNADYWVPFKTLGSHLRSLFSITDTLK